MRHLLSAALSFTFLLAPPVPGQAQIHAEARPKPEPSPPERPNILVIVADDLGVDIPGCYGESPSAANTPRIDALAAEGVLFRNAWANPVCSPTRAAMLTGRHGVSTGVGEPIASSDDFELSLAEPSLPRILAPTYATAAVGKWHLSTAGGTDTFHPLLMGFDHHYGPMGNLLQYAIYRKSVDGVLVTQVAYATTDQVDDALDFVETLPEPWFVWVAFNASHAPLHKPPTSLHTYTLPTMVSQDPPLVFRAMTEAMDTEIGRLLDGIPDSVEDDTYVVFVSDNGTPKHVTLPPFDPEHSKWTVYEGGVNVPLIVKGPGVARGAECLGLVHALDLFATVLELAGLPVAASSDSVSMVPYLGEPGRPSLREWVYAETFSPNGAAPTEHDVTVRDVDGHKLVRRYEGGPAPVLEEFYDLAADPFETTDLLLGEVLTPAQQAAFDALSAAMTGVLGGS